MRVDARFGAAGGAERAAPPPAAKSALRPPDLAALANGGRSRRRHLVTFGLCRLLAQPRFITTGIDRGLLVWKIQKATEH